uniref:Uncharacterized protein n=1 Tax=Tetranychus urticae TaxID=32264 RepID=T1KGH7_TETUR
MALMRKFVEFAGQDCKLYNVTIHIVNLENHYSRKLYEISDYKFLLDKDTFALIKPVAPMYFISVKNYPLKMNIKEIMDFLNLHIIESIQQSAILFGDSICIGFPTLWHAEKAISKYNEWRFYGTFLKAELLVDSHLTETLKCINISIDIKPVESKIKNEVKQLTFIKLNNSNEADDSEIIKFCIDCSTKSSSQCILSRKPFLWIVSSFKSDAQACLSKVQIKYPDAIIADPPVDLTSSYHENPYTVESCEQKVSIEATSPVDNEDANGWNIFFRRTSSLTGPNASTKLSLLYNLFEKLYDYGAKKVIFDGNVYCAHFDSVSLYQEVLRKIDSMYFSKLEFVNEQGLNKQLSKKLDRYKFNIPWCLTAELDIHCLVVKIDSTPSSWKIANEFWIGFPDARHCEEFKSRVKIILDNIMCPKDYVTGATFNKLKSHDYSAFQISTAKPSSALLESINLYDLGGNAYEFAFRLSQLQCFEPIAKPRIIERMSLLQTEKQECNAAVYYITVNVNFCDLMSCAKFSAEQVVKILVHLSEVIPLAATARYGPAYQVNLIFNSWHEASVARHRINKLKPAEVPYFTVFDSLDDCKKQFPGIFKYYVINEKGKVDEKMQSKNKEDKIDLNSSSVQSTSDVDVSDEAMMKKLEFLFVITTNPDVKFTRGMISIIEMHLVWMDCLAYIEFEDKIYVGFADFDRGYNASERIVRIKFKLLHNNDEDDFDVGVVAQSCTRFPPKVANLLANELRNPKKSSSNIYNIYSRHSAVPFQYFNYYIRKHLEKQSSNLVSLKYQLDPKTPNSHFR